MIDFKYSDLFTEKNVDKQLMIKTDNGLIEITNVDLHYEQFELEESLCSEPELRFGRCEASALKFRLSDLFIPLKDKWLTVTETLGGNTDVSFLFGRYKVFSDKPTADRKYRNIVAYDAMYDIINANVADWYNGILPNITSKVTMKQFRTSFIEHFGLEQEEVVLANDEMIVEKTVEPSEISGKDVITAICELNGCFGHIGRDGKFKYVLLAKKSDELYPAEDLYPADDLFMPGSNAIELKKRTYISCHYEDFVTSNITKLQIRKEENDIGALVGTGDNCYIVEDNFLIYGKTPEELEEIATNLLSVIKDIVYRPFEASLKGNPCLEVGDKVLLKTKYENVESFVLKRTLKGIQDIRDTFEADGTEYYSEDVNSVQKSIIQLRGKTNVLERDVEGTKSTISNLETKLENDYLTKKETESVISQTAEEITTSVSKQITETEKYADNAAKKAESNANANTDEKLKAYSTTTQMQSVINQSAESIKSEVSKTYVTQTSMRESVDNLQQQIDGAIETFSGSDVPTLSNYPVTEWTDDATKDTHIGDLYIVNADGGDNAGFYYRFEKTASGYQWTLLKDNEITKALQDAKEANEKAQAVEDDLKENYSTSTEMRSEIEQTANAINLEVVKKVGNDEVISKINQTAEKVVISAEKIDVDGVLDVEKLNALDIVAKNLSANKGTIAGWDITGGEICKEINLYPDMTEAGLSGVGDNDPVQYVVWLRTPTASNTATFYIGYRFKSYYLSGGRNWYTLFAARPNGEVMANKFKSSNAEITGGSIKISTNADENNAGSIIKLTGSSGRLVEINPYHMRFIDKSNMKFLDVTESGLSTYNILEFDSNDEIKSFTLDGLFLHRNGMISSQYTWDTVGSDSPNVIVTSSGLFKRSSSSSKRYKTDITECISDRLNPQKLYEVPVKMFKYKEGYLSKDDSKNGKDIIGFIVEDLEEKYASAVQYNANGEAEMWNSNIMIPAMLKLIQEQNQRILALEERLGE